ncbi:MAG: hypothetical protein OXF08_02560 [Bacteroidetes bacterium]|nr:hypothetical protein [Bacteroidota bacterium]
MKDVLLPIILLVLLIGGCVTTPMGVSVTSRAPKDSTSSGAVSPKRAWLFVDGYQQGATPATVRIRRNYEVSDISLHVGPEFDEVRRYELERSVTSNRIMMDFTFQGSYDSGMLTFNYTELSRDSQGHYVIPYYDRPFQIIDHEYDLVLIVSE